MPKYSFISSNDISYIPLVLQAFAIFCGMAIQNTVMYENVNKAMAKQKVALEVRIVYLQAEFFSSSWVEGRSICLWHFSKVIVLLTYTC